MADVSNQDDTIDSRDVESRIDELEAARADLESAIEDAETDLTFASHGDGDTTGELGERLEEARKALADWDAGEDADELKALKELRDEFEDYCSDWRHGTTLIRDSYFTEYCEDLVKDIGDLPRNLPSYIAIDWEKTAENIQADYTSGEFDGVTYWAR